MAGRAQDALALDASVALRRAVLQQWEQAAQAVQAPDKPGVARSGAQSCVAAELWVQLEQRAGLQSASGPEAEPASGPQAASLAGAGALQSVSELLAALPLEAQMLDEPVSGAQSTLAPALRLALAELQLEPWQQQFPQEWRAWFLPAARLQGAKERRVLPGSAY